MGSARKPSKKEQLAVLFKPFGDKALLDALSAALQAN